MAKDAPDTNKRADKRSKELALENVHHLMHTLNN